MSGTRASGVAALVLLLAAAGSPALARKVADIINCTEVTTKVDKTLMVDVSIIIGNDFEGQFVR